MPWFESALRVEGPLYADTPTAWAEGVNAAVEAGKFATETCLGLRPPTMPITVTVARHGGAPVVSVSGGDAAGAGCAQNYGIVVAAGLSGSEADLRFTLHWAPLPVVVPTDGPAMESSGGPFQPQHDPAVLVVEAPTVEGSLESAAVVAVIDRYRNQLRYCQQRELTKARDAQGDATVDFLVGDDGRVTRVNVEGTLTPLGLAACVQGRFARMQFASSGHVRVVVRYSVRR